MNYRLATIWPRQQYIANAVITADIDITDPVSRIIIAVEPDNNPTAANATGHPALCLTRVELIDGGTTLWAATGQELQGADFYDNSKETPQDIRYLAGNYSRMVFNMNFGRYLWDEVYAFDPKRFINPQLRLTITIAAGGDEANDLFLSVLAQCFDEKKVSPIGMLTLKNIKTYTLAATAWEYTDLPVDQVFKQIYLRPQAYGSLPDAQVAWVKLSEDVGKKIPLDHTLTEVIRNMVQEWPQYEEDILVWGQVAPNIYYCTPCQYVRFTDSSWRGPVVAGMTSSVFAGAGGQFTHSSSNAGPNWNVHAKGWAPHAMVPLLPKFGLDPMAWYDPKRIGNLKLEVLGGPALVAGTADIAVQQVRGY